MVDGHLNFDVKTDTAGFDKGTQAITKSFGGMKKVLIGISATLAGLFSAKEMIEYAAEVKALNAQYEQTFGTMQEAAGKAINAIAESSGIINTRLKGTATQIYAFAKTAGMDGTQALDLMSDALQVTADSAAYYDRSLEDTAATLQSFLKGNYANDAALGLSATETTRNAAAMELYGKKFQELDEAQKQFTLLQMVKDANRLSGAMGQAARESEGWENVLGNLKEAWKQLLAAVGQPLLALAIPIVKRLTAVLQTLTKFATQAANALAKVFGLDLGTGADNSEQIADNAEQAAESYEDMAAAAEEAKEANENSLASFDQINKLDDDKDSSKSTTAATPDTSSGALTGGTVSYKVDLDTGEASVKLESFFKAIRDGFTTLKTTASTLWQQIKKWATDNFGDIAWGFASGLQNEANELAGIFGRIATDAQTLIEPLKTYFVEDFTPFLSQVFSLASTIVLGLLDTFNLVFGDLWDVVVFPVLTSLIEDGLPVLTQFATESLATFETAFTSIKEIFDTVWTEGIIPALDLIVTIWKDIWKIIKKNWKEYGKPIFDGIREAITNTKDIILQVWKEWIKPVWDEVISAIKELWKKHLAPLLDNILGLFGDIATGALNFYNKYLAPFIQKVITALAPIVTWISKELIGTVKGAIAGIIDTLNGIVTFIRGVFTGNWSKAWEGVKKIFKGVWDAMKSIFKTPLNAIITLINGLLAGVIGTVNTVWKTIMELYNKLADEISFSITIPDWVPEIGGQTYNFAPIDKKDIWSIPVPQIPKLAQGTYIPKNYGEFLAVLGDNKREAEIVSPVSAMKQALLEALVEYGSVGGGDKQPLVVQLLLDRREIGRASIDDINERTRRNGKSPLVTT